MYAVVVSFTLKPGAAKTFMPLMYENAQASLRDEPGCHQFDVATNVDTPDEVFLYELYTDASAFESHLTTPHFISFDAAAADFIATKTVSTYNKVVQ